MPLVLLEEFNGLLQEFRFLAVIIKQFFALVFGIETFVTFIDADSKLGAALSWA